MYRSAPDSAELAVHADQVVELWYDYNPFGWQHANSWRVVYMEGTESQHLNIYDQDHLKMAFRHWLGENFPAHVAETFMKMYGYPGGDDPSLLVWSCKVEYANYTNAV